MSADTKIPKNVLNNWAKEKGTDYDDLERGYLELYKIKKELYPNYDAAAIQKLALSAVYTSLQRHVGGADFKGLILGSFKWDEIARCKRICAAKVKKLGEEESIIENYLDTDGKTLLDYRANIFGKANENYGEPLLGEDWHRDVYVLIDGTSTLNVVKLDGQEAVDKEIPDYCEVSFSGKEYKSGIYIEGDFEKTSEPLDIRELKKRIYNIKDFVPITEVEDLDMPKWGKLVITEGDVASKNAKWGQFTVTDMDRGFSKDQAEIRCNYSNLAGINYDDRVIVIGDGRAYTRRVKADVEGGFRQQPIFEIDVGGVVTVLSAGGDENVIEIGKKKNGKKKEEAKEEKEELAKEKPKKKPELKKLTGVKLNTAILSIISSLEKDQDDAKPTEVLDNAHARGIDINEDELMEVLNQLLEGGDIYEPNVGRYKTI